MCVGLQLYNTYIIKSKANITIPTLYKYFPKTN